MRQIGTIRDESEARQLADYLLTLGITTRLEPTEAGHALWVHHEDKVPEARRELAAFVQNPSDPRYQGHGTAARNLRKQAERAQREHLKNTLDVRYFWSSRDAKRCPVTWACIAICFGVTLASNFGADPRIVRPLSIASYEIVDLSVVPSDEALVGPVDAEQGVWIRSNLWSDLKRGQIWRLLTPIFLHFGPIHLAFNLSVLYQLGTLIEIRRGRGFLLALIVASGVLSNLGQYYYEHDPRFGGFSGVDLALFGYIWMKGLYEPEKGLGLSSGTVLFVVLLLAVTTFNPTFSFIAHAAHLVGLCVGILIGVAPHLLALGKGSRD